MLKEKEKSNDGEITKKLSLIILGMGLVILGLLLVMAQPASAHSITMANPDGTGQRDIIVYYANGTFYGRYNTTSVIDLNSTQDYIFTLKPQLTTIDDPGAWLAVFFGYVETNIIPIVLILFLGVYLLGRR